MTSLYDELEKKLQDSNATLMSLPLQFLKAITCDFSIEYELGRGGYGVVYKGVLQSGKIIAVKKLFEIHLLDDKTFQKEVSCLKEIKHQHVVQLIGYCAESSWELIDQPSGRSIWAEIPKRFLCFEYVCNKSLDKYISVPMDESSALGWYMRYETIKGICVGLNFLHEKCHIVHLDLKPENILMDASMIPKIADFGLSRIVGTQQSRIVTDNRAGSRGYMAPEYLIKGVVSMKADIFSLGAIIIEIITGHRDYPYFEMDDPQSTVTSCQHFIEKVLEMWRNKFESTLKYVTMESYIQQVRQCVTVALRCVNSDMEKRPTAKEILQVLNEVEQMEANRELPSEIWCKETSLVLDTTVNKEFIPHSTVEDLSNIETNGIVEDVNKAHDCLSRIPSWKSATYSQNDEEPAKEFSEPKQASDKTSENEAHKELPSDMPYTDKLLVQNSNAGKDVMPTSVTKDILNNEIDGKEVDEAISEGFSPGPSSELSRDNQNYQEAVTESNEPQLASVTRAEAPGEMWPEMKCTDRLLVLNTTATKDLDPQSVTAEMFVYKKDGKVVDKMKYDESLSPTPTLWQSSVGNQNYQQGAQASSDLKSARETTMETEHSIPPSIKIISLEGNNGYSISVMDVNQTEPLIITGTYGSSVQIWNSDMQKYVGSIDMPKKGLEITSLKFIARMGWFLASTDDGLIHVCNYKKETPNITSIRAHGSFFKPHGSHTAALAIHPTQSYVLSACATTIKLLDWDHRWKCVRRFDEHSAHICALAFNPEDYNSFASASCDGTIKVWCLDSPTCKYTLSGHSNSVRCLDFFTRDGQQYLISGSWDNTAKIWDMQKKKCISTLPHRSAVRYVLPHPKLPLLVTGATNGLVYLWSSTDFRLKRTLKTGLIGCVQSIACLNESGRMVVAHAYALSVIEINDEEEGQGSSNGNNENVLVGRRHSYHSQRNEKRT